MWHATCDGVILDFSATFSTAHVSVDVAGCCLCDNGSSRISCKYITTTTTTDNAGPVVVASLVL